MELLEINRNAFSSHENSLLIHLMDTKPLSSDQCYMVVGCPFNSFYVNKNELENYMTSLAPNFKYNNLSELAFHLIKNEIILDVSMTKKIN